MPVLRPKPGEVLKLPFNPKGSQGSGSSGFQFVSFPKSPQMVYKIQAGKATIYQVLDEAQDKWALKVFHAAFRKPAVLDSNALLQKLLGKPGLDAATRIVFTSQDEIVGEYKELEYGVLMPWIIGQTCFDMYMANAKSPTKFSREEALGKARDVVTVISGLEREGYVHTDVSSGNLIIPTGSVPRQPSASSTRYGTQLIDLEDIWFKGRGVPDKPHYTPGYGHPSLQCGATAACPAGDRYATIVLVAEILMLSEPELASKFTPEGYFQADITDAEARDRYERAQERLKRIYPAFSDALADAWKSKTLNECSEIGLLLPTLVPSTVRHRIFDDFVESDPDDSSNQEPPILTIFEDEKRKQAPPPPPPLPAPTFVEQLMKAFQSLANTLKGLFKSIFGK
ncbi:MAG: hypothetical protein JWL77_4868 [Chthonomonadaceae bacterium]|nr:hypothetical protein [Chthonomonadaceae bacterium]